MTTASSESLRHAKWDGKYQGVVLPTGRKHALGGKMRTCLGPVVREWAGQRGSTIVEGPMVHDPGPMLLRMPPK